MTISKALVPVSLFCLAAVAAWVVSDVVAGHESRSVPAPPRADLANALPQLRGSLRPNCASDRQAEDTADAAPPTSAGITPAPSKDPRLSVDFATGAKALDFGDVRYGTMMTAVLHVRNSGSQPLILTDVSSPCDCIRAEHPQLKEPIAPGTTRDIDLSFHATSETGGKYTKTIILLSNDPKMPRFRLRAIANVLLALRIREPLLTFRFNSRGDGTAVAHIAGLTGESDQWKITKVRAYGATLSEGMRELKFEVAYTVGSAGERVATITVHHARFRAPGKYCLPVLFDSDHPEHPYLLVQAVFEDMQ